MTGRDDSRSILPIGAKAADDPASWGSVLVVAGGYMASPRSSGIGKGSSLLRCFGILWRILTLERHRTFVRVYRDFYANPRSGAYMAMRLDEFFRDRCPGALATVIAAPGALDWSAPPDWVAKIKALALSDGGPPPGLSGLAPAVEAEVCHTAFDAALVVHPDAIGLGQEPVERLLDAALPGRLFALSGRRRLRHLDAPQRRRLRIRRFMAETRIYEFWLARWYRLASVFYAAADMLDSRQPGRGGGP